jgi:hypothetical protein
VRTSWISVVLALVFTVLLGDVLAVPAVAATGRIGLPSASSVVAIDSAVVAQQPPGATTTPQAPNGTNPGMSKQEAEKKIWLVLVAAALFGLVYTGRRIRKARKKPSSG